MTNDSPVKRQLPEYEHPPIGEVIFGIQFASLTNMKPPYVGLFWDRLGRKEYPELEQRPPLPHTIENGISKVQQPVLIESSLDFPPLSRCFFVSPDRNHLVQMQVDRLLQNWRKLKPKDDYPRYAKLFPQFIKTVAKLAEFIKDEKLGVMQSDQFELTYINHIPKGQGWETLDDVPRVFPQIATGLGGKLLKNPESISCGRAFQLPDGMGRLHVLMQLAIAKDTSEPLLLLTLTARGHHADMARWFDTAHAWIVNGFTELTGPEIQKKVWGRKV
jgi:uncharacterized protein (TIGR04255 family)